MSIVFKIIFDNFIVNIPISFHYLGWF